MKILKRPRQQAARRRASSSRLTRPVLGDRESTTAPHPETHLSRQGCHMTSLTQDPDITSWLQLLGAVEEAEAGHGTARLTEICLSVYGELAAAQFQIIQLRARIHALAASDPSSHVVR